VKKARENVRKEFIGKDRTHSHSIFLSTKPFLWLRLKTCDDLLSCVSEIIRTEYIELLLRTAHVLVHRNITRVKLLPKGILLLMIIRGFLWLRL